MRVGIVGGGTGGPAVALFLARAGHQVTLFERVHKPSPVGAGILLQPTGMSVLRRLGLAQNVLAHGSRVERLFGRNAAGRTILDLSYGDLAPELFGLGIHRGSVFSVLWEAVLHQPGITISTGSEANELSESSGAATLNFTDRPAESFDRVIVASGARSPLRPPGSVVKPYPWGALWAVVKSDVSAGTLTQRYRDTRQMVGLLPSGDGKVSLFWSLRAEALNAWKSAGIQAWKAEVVRLMPEAPVDSLESTDEVLFAPYFDVSATAWHTERCVWIGDVAHAMSPQLGQGANLALVDAKVLADIFSENLPLAEYTRRRRAHLRFYSWASWGLTPFFQSNFTILAPPRDIGSAVFHAWPWYRKRMVEALCGAKVGILGEELGLRT